MMRYEYTRKEMYDMVWAEPVRVLAPKIGVSDTAIRKACQKAKIPRPGAGYWAKLKAGKKPHKARLLLRFPGMSDSVIFMKNYNFSHEKEDLDKPIPPLPEYEEDLDSLRERVIKLVGKASYPQLSRQPHSIIDKFLQQDEVRRKEYEEKGYSWSAPLYGSPIEKRRLRILNAIFLAAHKLGCKPNMSTSKYESDNRGASICVGDRHVSFVLKEVKPKGRASSHSSRKKYLSLDISGNSRDRAPRHSWLDTDETRLESFLTDIIVEIVMAGELQYREGVQQHHDLDVKFRERDLKERHQKRIEEERQARELKEQKDQDRIDKLLFEATSLQQAEIIRGYVSTIRLKSSEIEVSEEKIDNWAEWALAQADRIDPIKNGKFVNY